MKYRSFDVHPKKYTIRATTSITQIELIQNDIKLVDFITVAGMISIDDNTVTIRHLNITDFM